MNQFDRKNITPEWVGLVNEFPEIFLEPSPDVLNYFAEAVVKGWNNTAETYDDLCNLRYGFECDIGWKEIIRVFCIEIRELIQKAKDVGDEIHFKTFILKEKFGECHSQGDFYGPNRDKYWKDYCVIVSRLLDKSLSVCEITGAVGKRVRRKGGWCKTLCEEQAEKLEYEY
jgi:hypothetical protein